MQRIAVQQHALVKVHQHGARHVATSCCHVVVHVDVPVLQVLVLHHLSCEVVVPAQLIRKTDPMCVEDETSNSTSATAARNLILATGSSGITRSVGCT